VHTRRALRTRRNHVQGYAVTFKIESDNLWPGLHCILTSDFLLDINAARLWLRRPGQRHPLVVAAGPLSLLPGVSAL
jgi:hypothetical protein